MSAARVREGEDEGVDRWSAVEGGEESGEFIVCDRVVHVVVVERWAAKMMDRVLIIAKVPL